MGNFSDVNRYFFTKPCSLFFSSYLGRHILIEFGNTVADIYVGEVQYPTGPLSVTQYKDPISGAFLGLVVAGEQNVFSFAEFWFGNWLCPCAPPDFIFDLPEECDIPLVSSLNWFNNFHVLLIREKLMKEQE